METTRRPPTDQERRASFAGLLRAYLAGAVIVAGAALAHIAAGWT